MKQRTVGRAMVFESGAFYDLATFAADRGPAFHNPFQLYVRRDSNLFLSALNPRFFTLAGLPGLQLARRLVCEAAASGTSVADLCNAINLGLCARPERRPIALFCAVYDVAEHWLTYVAAGQYAYIISADGESRILDAGGTTLGHDRNYVYFEGREVLQPHDLLISYNYQFSMEFDAGRLLEIAREQVRANATATAIRDQVMDPWSRRRMQGADANHGSALFFIIAAGPQQCALATSTWEAETKHFESEETRAFWSYNFAVVADVGNIRAAA